VSRPEVAAVDTVDPRRRQIAAMDSALSFECAQIATKAERRALIADSKVSMHKYAYYHDRNH
jgi:hypothetical protein